VLISYRLEAHSIRNKSARKKQKNRRKGKTGREVKISSRNNAKRLSMKSSHGPSLRSLSIGYRGKSCPTKEMSANATVTPSFPWSTYSISF
jgi:hypothetical protein|tara:strand:- start:567 stop:839 length:273 start_codon:yes stop_codon:yes gene_type:complete